MKTLNLEIEQFLRSENVDFVHFVNISILNKQQNRGLPYAILMGIAINPQFIKGVYENPHYIHSALVDDKIQIYAVKHLVFK